MRRRTRGRWSARSWRRTWTRWMRRLSRRSP
jgi:hypothetical protein